MVHLTGDHTPVCCSSYDDQYYASHSVNLGFVDRFQDNLFLTQTPEYSVDLRATLF